MKNFLYIFAVWVMLSNGQVWKYPQGEGWVEGGSPRSYKNHTFALTCSNGSKEVVQLPQWQVSKIGFSMKECWTQGYFVFHNPSCVAQNGTPVHSDDEEVYINKDHVRTERSSEGKSFMPPAHIVHFDDVKQVWK